MAAPPTISSNSAASHFYPFERLHHLGPPSLASRFRAMLAGDDNLWFGQANVMNKGRRQFVICVDNDGYAASLERGKIYVSIPDAEAQKHGLIRIVDESGEDYLYPKTFFRPVDLPQPVKRAVLASA